MFGVDERQQIADQINNLIGTVKGQEWADLKRKTYLALQAFEQATWRPDVFQKALSLVKEFRLADGTLIYEGDSPIADIGWLLSAYASL